MVAIEKLKLETLVYLIESQESLDGYSRQHLIDELTRRAVPADELRQIVQHENQMIARMKLEDDNLAEEVSLHNSHFITEEEVREIYLQLLEERMQYKNGFRFNVWNYAIGGI